MKSKTICFVSLLCTACLLAACSGLTATTVTPSAAATAAGTVQAIATVTPEPMATPVPAPTPLPALQVLSVSADADPQVLPEKVDDPYSQINKNLLASMHPDRDQYNLLYRAVENMEKKVDVSSFKLSRIQMNNLVGCLDVNYRLFYIKKFKVSRNGKTVEFTYSGTDAKIQHDRETFQARMNHLIYNVAPEGYSSLQKFMAVYEAICEMSNYTATPSDGNTCTPYSIVMNGSGVCWGYSLLTEYVLNKLGIPAQYVCNNPHAWDVVKLGGKWYYTDVTWGAGNVGDTLNNLHTVLMDDAMRIQTMKDIGTETGEFTLGFSRADAPKPPACTDASFNVYNEIGYCYTFDVDHNKIYFNSEKGIESMNLDCTGRETIAKDTSAYQMAFFNGKLYYLDTINSFLYQMTPGQKPELLDGSASLDNLKLDGTTLTYEISNSAGNVKKSIPLLPIGEKALTAGNVKTLPGAAILRSQSFSFRVKFSLPVGETQNWNEGVYLVDHAGKTIPLYFCLSKDGTELTVRPKTCVADAGSVSLFIKSGIAPAQGNGLESACRMDVAIQ
jgi:hypothetical protein